MMVATEPKQVLLVEDNADDEQFATRALRQCEIPLVIKVARDGEQAIEFLHGDPNLELPDLVLLDLKLPKINGIEVLARIRAHDRTRNLPVVVVTSSDEDRDIYDCYGLGVNSYIRKPVDYSAFLDAMRQLGTYWLALNQPPAKSS
jgi:two-component system response regulator